MSLQNIIETAFENRAQITPQTVSAEVKQAVEETLRQLDSGTLRVAERRGVGQWQVNEWAKKAVLLSFRIADNEVLNDGVNQYFDKVPTKFAGWSEDEFRAAGFRAVPGAVARRGSFVGKKRRPHALLCQHRRVCGRRRDGGHLGHRRLLRPNRQKRAFERRRRHRRRARTLAGRPTISKTTALSARAAKSSKA